MAPIACTLTASDYARRTADLSALAARALRTRVPTERGERLVFTDSVERELRDVIAAEARCCPFLQLDLQRTEGGLVLDITGPDDARPLMAELFSSR